MNKSTNNVRKLALDLLIRIGDQGGYSHLLIDQILKNHDLDARDGALLTEIVYGTLQRKLTLEYDLTSFIQTKKKIDKWVQWLLILSFYQMKYLDKVPDHAIIHESVEIAKRKGHKGVANFVNGILRSAQRDGFPDYRAIKDPVERISIETSHPYWLVERWINQYGIDITEQMCETNISHKKMSVRVQPMRVTRDELIENLRMDGLEVSKSSVSSQGIVIEKGNILKHSSFQNALFTIQDESSMLVAELMDLSDGMDVLDPCSAPGGKATHIAEKMKNTGAVYAYDLHEKKVNLVKQKANTLGLSSIHADQSDARELRHKHSDASFDRILVDAPCSGLGVLRSKPDIKYNKNEQDMKNLSLIQLDILNHVQALLKKEGKLIYSTCTVDKQENEEVIKTFLKENQSFRVDPFFFDELPELLKHSVGISEFGVQIFPQDMNSDGFFITKLIKVS